MKSMRRQKRSGSLRISCRRRISLLLAILFLLDLSVSLEFQNIAVPILVNENGDFIENTSERLSNTCYATLESGGWKISVLENERNGSISKTRTGKKISITLYILFMLVPQLFLTSIDSWCGKCVGIVPRSLLMVRYLRRADGKKNGIATAQT